MKGWWKELNNEPNNNPTDEMSESAQNAGKKVAKKAAKKAGKAVRKIAAKVLLKTLVLLAPYILLILLLIGIVIAGYYVMYEIRGSEQVFVYDKRAENTTKVDADKEYERTSQGTISGQTNDIQTYYKYMSEHSYWQITGDDNTKLEQTTDVRDYYGKEEQYYLNNNFIFALDETMHRKKFIYPEQFIKPVFYDPEKLELKDLTDEEGRLVTEGDVYDSDGEKTDKKEKSVEKYGLASVFKYKKDKRVLTVEGTMYKKDVWDDGCMCKKSVDTNEPFEYTMEGFPEDIWIMTKAVTFVGEFEFTYETQKNKTEELEDNSEPGQKNEAVKKIQVGIGKEYRTESYTVQLPDGTSETKTRKVFVKDHPLYGYRKGGIYESLPVVKETKPTDKGQKYLRDFLYNYKINLPFSVMGEFDLQARVGGDGVPMMLDPNIKAGSLVDSSTFQQCLQHLPLVQRWSTHFGIDPYLVLAKMAQESGCRTNIKDGPMQIVGNGSRTVSAVNASGQKETYTIHNESERRNMEKAVRWGVMYFKSLTDMMDGDPLKALQGYNFGEAGVLYIKKKHPDAWKNGTEWMKWREESRLHYGGQTSRSVSYDCAPELKKTTGSVYGDTCYVEHVLRYYAGKTMPTPSTPSNGEDGGIVEDVVDGITDIFNGIKDAIKDWVKDYSKETKYKNYEHLATVKEVDWGLRLAGSMQDYVVFSETKDGDLNFWEKGFSDSLSGDAISLNPDLAGFTPPLNTPNPRVTSPFGMRIHPIYGYPKMHKGIDLALTTGTPVCAIGDGVVIKAVGDQKYSKKGYGNVVRIKHDNGTESVYAHLDSTNVQLNQKVTRGQLIGLGGTSGGSTGPHLHFEILINGKHVDPKSVAVRPDAFK